MKRKRDLPNCWHLYKLLKYIYIFHFCLPWGPSGNPWFLQKQLQSTTRSGKTETFLDGVGAGAEDGAAEPRLHFGGSKHRLYRTIICTDWGTWILRQLDSDLNRHAVGWKLDLLAYQSENGRLHLLAPLGFLTGLTSHISALDWRTDISFISSEVPLGTSLWTAHRGLWPSFSEWRPTKQVG